MGRADGLSRLPISVIFQEPTGADCTELATDDTEGLATQSEGVEGTQVSTTRMMEATRIKPNEPYRMRQSVRETRRMRADTDSCEADTMRTALTERMGLDVLSPEVKVTGRRHTEQYCWGSLRTERATGTYDGPSEKGETEPEGCEETHLPLLEGSRTGIVDQSPEVPYV
ncbi:hypothetical protein B5M09_005105 [Aphanomyces astaci]|uniref:Uncharacterized protein n=1 Tax=Aphanomyces astaci TaxID=112090 RepID=A0A3R7W265_APHAT|nr:hypothetical protein B5M09_005105 [Aphanomyces astaci]